MENHLFKVKKHTIWDFWTEAGKISYIAYVLTI